MNTKDIPAIMTLSAGAITSIITFRLGYEVKTMLGILLLVLLIFYGAGLLIKYILDSFQRDIDRKELEEKLKKEEELAAEREKEEKLEEERKRAKEEKQKKEETHSDFFEAKAE